MYVSLIFIRLLDRSWATDQVGQLFFAFLNKHAAHTHLLLTGYGTSAFAALTAQNTQGVDGVLGVEPPFLEAQINSLFNDIPPVAIKTGMLYSDENIKAIVRSLSKFCSRESHPPCKSHCTPGCTLRTWCQIFQTALRYSCLCFLLHLTLNWPSCTESPIYSGR